MNDAIPNPPPPPPPVAYPSPAPYGMYPPPVYNPRAKSVATAAILSILPGLGHVYLGLYNRGFIFFAVHALCITTVAEGRSPLPFALLIPFWFFFVMVDAMRQAKLINETGRGESDLRIGSSWKLDGSLTAGVFLILVGLFFTLNRYFDIDLTFLLDNWPLLLIAIGAWQVFGYMKARQQAATDSRPVSPSIDPTETSL